VQNTLKVYKVKIVDSLPLPAAKVDSRGLIVPCLDGNILLEEIQPAGKKKMSGVEFSRGIQVSKGIPELF
jgi:methionyl-tRNA formyltransferase